NKLRGAVEREGMTLVPLKLYFNPRGRAKIELAVARGKKLHDKRETEKKRSWERERGRLMREKGGAARGAHKNAAWAHHVPWPQVDCGPRLLPPQSASRTKNWYMLRKVLGFSVSN